MVGMNAAVAETERRGKRSFFITNRSKGRLLQINVYKRRSALKSFDNSFMSFEQTLSHSNEAENMEVENMGGSSQRRSSREELLPMQGSLHVERKSGDRWSFAYNVYIMASMTFIWTGYTITVRYTRSTTPENELYAATTVVLLSEITKLCVTIICIFKMSRCNISAFKKCILEEYFGKPLDLLKMSVPSIMYAVQNNLDIVALSNLDAGTYQVTTQLKVVTTAVFMMLILGRRFSLRRWIAIFLLFLGVAAVQLNALEDKAEVKAMGGNYIVGVIAVLITCAIAGFAGVYFEMMLKDGSTTPFWIRNLQMYSCGVVSAATACYLGEADVIVSRGFLYGYNLKVYAVVGFLSFGGIYISLVMKYLDNLYKTFASAMSIILVVIVSLFVFETVYVGIFFVAGTATVIGSIILYNSVDE